LNDLGWKLFNALFPRTLESFSRRFADVADEGEWEVIGKYPSNRVILWVRY
jgi:hypothetical protein